MGVLVAFKRLGMEPQLSVLDALEEQLLKKMPYFKNRELTLALWSLSQLGHEVPEALMREFSCRIPSLPQDEACEAEDIARVFYAYAKMNYVPPAVQLEGLRRALQAHVNRLEPNHICCVAWAIATMPDAFASCLARTDTPSAPPAEGVGVEPAGNHLPISRRRQGASLMDKLCDTAAKRISEFDMGQLVWLMWSLATLNYNVEPANMGRFMQEIDSRMYYVSEADLVGLIWAAARLNFSAYGTLGTSIFERSEEAVSYHLNKMSPGKVTSLLGPTPLPPTCPARSSCRPCLAGSERSASTFTPCRSSESPGRRNGSGGFRPQNKEGLVRGAQTPVALQKTGRLQVRPR